MKTRDGLAGSIGGEFPVTGKKAGNFAESGYLRENPPKYVCDFSRLRIDSPCD